MVSRNSLRTSKKNGNAPLVAELFVFTTKHVMPAGKPRKKTESKNTNP
jgi:hypothetical protein